MIIVKHKNSSSTHPDQTKHTVLNNLMKKLNKVDDNWEMFTWEKEIQKEVGGDSIIHKVKYLKHKINEHIITSQYKAWNDTIRQMMWLELVMGPIQREAEKTGDKVFIIQDNCGLHKTDDVDKQYVDLNMTAAFLPENMTAILQVMDLIVNGLLKTNQRNYTAQQIVVAFREYRDKVIIKGYKNVPKFKPPRPSLHDGIINLLKQFDSGPFQELKLKASMTKCFQDTGCAPYDKCEFKQYKESKILCGTTPLSNTCSVIDLTVENASPIEEFVEEYISALQHCDDSDQDKDDLENENNEFLEDDCDDCDDDEEENDMIT